ncbi:MAG: class I SAM-dependent methyltransferase [Deltaproteobacteria bacterium]|nr:MAG: class I SAM-dependent methyltransferase [Deltaproteobacteria bacterium]
MNTADPPSEKGRPSEGEAPEFPSRRDPPPPSPLGVLDEGYAVARREDPVHRFRLQVRARVVAHAARGHFTSFAGLRVLDLGAAEGRTLLELARLLPGARFTGVEFSRELIAAAPSLPAQIELIEGDVTRLDLPDGRFDLVCALALLEHLDDPGAAVREAWRVLRQGGLFVATAPDPFWDHLAERFGLLAGEQHAVEMDRDRLLSTVETAGFTAVRYRRFMFAPVAFLPYLHLPVPPGLSLRLDRLLDAMRIFAPLFVNQAIVGVKGEGSHPR